MDGYRLRGRHGDTIDPRLPLPVSAMQGLECTQASETITYNGKAAAGAITVNGLLCHPVVSLEGDQIASYWGSPENLCYTAYVSESAKHGANTLVSLTETATSAAFVVYDAVTNLELMFESLTTTTKRFIAKATDKAGGTLYGWIMGVAVSTNVYTFDAYNLKTLETGKSWVGTLTAFDNTDMEKVEIFHYNSSIAFATGTTLTEEVAAPKEYSKGWGSVMSHAGKLSNGQYFVDYLRGRIIGKRADATASETVTYNTLVTKCDEEA